VTALVAPNVAHVLREHLLASQNRVADVAGRGAHVDVQVPESVLHFSLHGIICQNNVANYAGFVAKVNPQVPVAIKSSTKCLLTHAANVLLAWFGNISGRHFRPGWQLRDQGVAWKYFNWR
jgi:hypothetical protein